MLYHKTTLGYGLQKPTLVPIITDEPNNPNNSHTSLGTENTEVFLLNKIMMFGNVRNLQGSVLFLFIYFRQL
jgi:hypothetical protein